MRRRTIAGLARKCTSFSTGNSIHATARLSVSSDFRGGETQNTGKKPILDRGFNYETSPQRRGEIWYGIVRSTRLCQSNVSVGPPTSHLCYELDSLRLDTARATSDEDDPYLQEISRDGRTGNHQVGRGGGKKLPGKTSVKSIGLASAA